MNWSGVQVSTPSSTAFLVSPLSPVAMIQRSPISCPALTDISVSDPKLGPVTCPETSLEPGESMECDDVTFPGKSAIWSQDAYDRTLNAWEIPAGSCGIGGGGAAGAATPVAETPETDCLPGVPGLPCGGQAGGGNPGNAQPNNAPTTVPATPAPPTEAPVAPPPATPAPTGGRAGTITAPDTGTGDGTGAGSMFTWLLTATVIATAGGGAVLAGRRIRR